MKLKVPVSWTAFGRMLSIPIPEEEDSCDICIHAVVCKRLTEYQHICEHYQASAEVKLKYDAIILCKHEGNHLEMLDIRLPHQVYEETLENYLDKFPKIREFIVIPVNSKEYISLAGDFSSGVSLKKRENNADS